MIALVPEFLISQEGGQKSARKRNEEAGVPTDDVPVRLVLNRWPATDNLIVVNLKKIIDTICFKDLKNQYDFFFKL